MTDCGVRCSGQNGAIQKASSKGLAHWVDEIKVTFSSGKAGTIRLARVVSEAKRALPYGQWTEIWRSGLLPFSKRKGEMLTVIGQSLGSLDAHNCAHLPASWRALYYLARLERPVLLHLIAEGVIHPALRIEEAKQLLTSGRIPTNQRRNALTVSRWLLRIANFVRRKLSDWTPAERQMASLELAALAKDLSNKPSERFREYNLSSSDNQSSNRLFPATTTL